MIMEERWMMNDGGHRMMEERWMINDTEEEKISLTINQSINRIFNVLGTNWGPTDKISVQ